MKIASIFFLFYNISLMDGTAKGTRVLSGVLSGLFRYYKLYPLITVHDNNIFMQAKLYTKHRNYPFRQFRRQIFSTAIPTYRFSPASCRLILDVD